MQYDEWIAHYNKACGCKEVLPAYFEGEMGLETFLQCQKCGLSRPKTFSELPRDAVPYDIQAQQAFTARRADEWVKRLTNEQLEATKKKKGYHAYLDTGEWKEIRKKVLMRDNGMCQGCLMERATQVHHLTYAHVKKELAFELVSLCEGCHKKVHDL